MTEGVLLFLAAQTGAFLFWAGRITQQQSDHTRRITELEEVVKHNRRRDDENV